MSAPSQPSQAPAPASTPASQPSSSQQPTSTYADAPSLNSWDSFPVNGLPAEPATTTEEAPAEETPGDTRTETRTSEEPAEQQDSEAAVDLETFIQNEAAQNGLDPSNPTHRKILKRIFDSQAHIRTLESERKTQPSATPNEQEILERATEFEQQALGLQPQPPPAQGEYFGQPGQATAPSYNLRLTQHGQLELGDVGDEWKEPSDGYLAQNAAWQGALSEGGTFRDVIAVDNSMFTRRLYGNEDHIRQMVTKHLREQFPELLTVSHRTRMDQDREFALGQLEKAGLKDVRDMFQADNAGQPITFNGIQFDNSAFNRVVSKNPWLLDLRKNHSDPRKAEQLSAIAKVRVAYAIWKREAANGAKPESAQVQKLMQNGADMERRKQQDRARQGMNSGGRGPVNNSNGQARSYVQSLTELPDEQRSIDELLR